MKKEITTQNENEVVIHQSVARLRGKLTTTQSRSMLSILKRANDIVAENPDVVTFKIPTDLFLQDITVGEETRSRGAVVAEVSKHLEKLMVQIFIWGTEEKLSKAVFMQQLTVTPEEVTFKFSDYIREHIKPIASALIVKDFVLMQSFRSEYARQLYKHLMMWDSQGVCYLSIKDFRDFLGIPNTKSYERMDNLKRKVIDVAMAEINEKCPMMDLRYSNRIKKGSRVIEGFNFAWFKEQHKKKKIIEEKKAKSKVEVEEKKLKNMEQKLQIELLEHVGKKLYLNGCDWKIISVSKIKNNMYQVFLQEIDDKSYTRVFDISKVQLECSKPL